MSNTDKFLRIARAVPARSLRSGKRRGQSRKYIYELVVESPKYLLGAVKILKNRKIRVLMEGHIYLRFSHSSFLLTEFTDIPGYVDCYRFVLPTY